MVTPFGSSTLIAISVQKCRHAEGKKIIINERNATQVDDLFYKFHPYHKNTTYSLQCGPDNGAAEGHFEVQSGAGITVRDVNVKSFLFTPECETGIQAVRRPQRKAANTFVLLMAGGEVSKIRELKGTSSALRCHFIGELFQDYPTH